MAALLEPYTLTRLREVQALLRLREVQALLRLREEYVEERLERACRRARDQGDGRYRTVRGLLERRLDEVAPEDPPEPRGTVAFLRGPAAFAPWPEQREGVRA